MAVILAGALIAGGASAAAQPDLDDEPDYLVPTEAKDVVDRPLPDRFSGKATVPVAVAEALLRIEVEHPDIGLSGSEWDPEDGRVAVYATADPAVVGDILEKYGVSRSVDVRTAERSATEKAEVVRQITGDDGKLSSGHQVVSVAPSIDGSRFDVTLSEDVQLRSSVVLPQVDAEVSVQYGPDASPVVRNHAPGQEKYSGAYMHRSGSSCSSGFRMVDQETSEPAMASAHHCGVTVGEQWYYNSTTNHVLGQFQGGLYPGSTHYGDITSWKGAGLSDFVPGIFIGDHTVAGSGVYPIRGAVGATLGTNICYSGSRTDTICGNEITQTGASVCYTDEGICYFNLVFTEQLSGSPAAGSGDSGGPAYIPYNPQGPYAAGVISGIFNGTAECTGDPGSTAPNGRKCSDKGLFAVEGGHGVSPPATRSMRRR